MAKNEAVKLTGVRHTNPRPGSITKFVFDLLAEYKAKTGRLPDFDVTLKAVKKQFLMSKYDKRHFAYYRYHFLRNQAIWNAQK